MANICWYQIKVSGKKRNAKFIYESMPCYEQGIFEEKGNDDNYQLSFRGECAYSVDARCDDNWQETDDISKVTCMDSEEYESNVAKYMRCKLQDKSRIFNCSITVLAEYEDFDVSSGEGSCPDFIQYNNGQIEDKKTLSYNECLECANNIWGRADIVEVYGLTNVIQDNYSLEDNEIPLTDEELSDFKLAVANRLKASDFFRTDIKKEWHKVLYLYIYFSSCDEYREIVSMHPILEKTYEEFAEILTLSWQTKVKKLVVDDIDTYFRQYTSLDWSSQPTVRFDRESGCTLMEDVVQNTTWLVSYMDDRKSLFLPKKLFLCGYIMAGCFENTNIEEISIPMGYERIESHSFSNCRNLKYIKMPKTIKYIADDAFEGTNEFTIITKEGTAADIYAKNKGIKVEYSQRLYRTDEEEKLFVPIEEETKKMEEAGDYADALKLLTKYIKQNREYGYLTVEDEILFDVAVRIGTVYQHDYMKTITELLLGEDEENCPKQIKSYYSTFNKYNSLEIMKEDIFISYLGNTLSDMWKQGRKAFIRLALTACPDDVVRKLIKSFSVNIDSNMCVGDTVKLGKYEDHDIFWRILDVDDQKVVMISEFIIFDSPYNKKGKEGTWATSSLRKYLNNDFLQNSFNDYEKSRILPRVNDNSDKRSSDSEKTEDKVYLLSSFECKKYFAEKNSKKALYEEYIKLPYDFYDLHQSNWWLRSPIREGYADFVEGDTVKAFKVEKKYGGVYISSDCGYMDGKRGIRPVVEITKAGV